MKKSFFGFEDQILELSILEHVYEPQEDSYLLARNIPKNLKGKKVLDIGSGSGILSVICAKSGGVVTAVDLFEKAIANTKLNAKLHGVNIDVLESDLFEKIEGKFDFIVYNPAYIPVENEGIEGEIAWVGGKNGRMHIDKFLKNFKPYLNKGGIVLMLVSSKNNIVDELKKNGWKEIDSRVLFFEKLFIMKFAN